MSTAIAIFVKTPSLSPVKTRLAATIGEGGAKEFYGLCLKAVQRTVENIEAVSFWVVAEKEGLDNSLWSAFKTLYAGEGGLGEQQHHIYEELLKTHDRVLLIGADAPQLSPEVIQEAVTSLDAHDFVIGPARDGGYYLFGGRVPLDKKIWIAVPWSSAMTRNRLEAVLPSKSCQLTLLTDVDTQDDLICAAQEMPKNMSAEQKNILNWIENNENPVSLYG